MTQITYEVTLDENNEFVTELKVTTLCASKAPGSAPVSKEEALTTKQHIASLATYRFSQLGEVERFPIPEAAAKTLR